LLPSTELGDRAMAYLLKNLTNSIWHAFHALQTDATNTVAKSKLKVKLWKMKCY